MKDSVMHEDKDMDARNGEVRPKLSVVVCTKNEEDRIGDCLVSVLQNKPDEILVVDGASSDKTVEIAEKLATRVIRSGAGNLSLDRQKGIDEARNDLVAMIDADHRLEENDLADLYRDLVDFNLDIVQSQLRSYKDRGFWISAEGEVWDLTHNNPGPKTMIGTAPAIFRKKVFERARFDGEITKTIDDTDFIYRLSKYPEIKIGIGRVAIFQEHESDFHSYIKKFMWYGRGDGEFCRKHPNRAFSMIFHLLVRYPFFYPLKALRRGKFKAVPFYIIQASMRIYGLLKYFLTGK